MQQHQAGNLPQAEQIYQQILQASRIIRTRCTCWDCSPTKRAATRKEGNISDVPSLWLPLSRIFTATWGWSAGHWDLGRIVGLFPASLELDPNIAETHTNLGNSLRQQGDRRKLSLCYQRALQLRPNQPEAHNNLGLMLDEEGRSEEASFTLS